MTQQNGTWLHFFALRHAWRPVCMGPYVHVRFPHCLLNGVKRTRHIPAVQCSIMKNGPNKLLLFQNWVNCV